MNVENNQRFPISAIWYAKRHVCHKQLFHRKNLTPYCQQQRTKSMSYVRDLCVYILHSITLQICQNFNRIVLMYQRTLISA